MLTVIALGKLKKERKRKKLAKLEKGKMNEQISDMSCLLSLLASTGASLYAFQSTTVYHC